MSRNDQSVHVARLRSVTKTYPTAHGEFTALDDLSLSLSRGAVTAIVGKSGSGKSTLLNLLAGIDRPRSGEVLVDDAPLHAMNETQLAGWRGLRVGVVFQFFQLLPTLTVLENVWLPMDLCGTCGAKEGRARALALLSRVGIAEQAHKLPSALSGGQQQRAAIARALANDPPLILADEPTGNLDSRTAESILALLRELSRSGKSVVLVTHERDVARLADRVITLADGKIVDDSAATLGARTSA